MQLNNLLYSVPGNTEEYFLCVCPHINGVMVSCFPSWDVLCKDLWKDGNSVWDRKTMLV